jgi:hypothetical protein
MNPGDDRDRTGNLRLAKPALSQLSYVPLNASVVGVLGFEPRTSALSELRSSQLSYTPCCPRLALESLQIKRPNHIWFGPIRIVLDRASTGPANVQNPNGHEFALQNHEAQLGNKNYKRQASQVNHKNA